MAILRLGTAGAAQLPGKLNDLLIASEGSILVRWVRKEHVPPGGASRSASDRGNSNICK